MSVKMYFGLPGSGKTTYLAYLAKKYSKEKMCNVYSNVDLNIPQVIKIENDYVGKYRLHDGVILIDEGTIFADSRNFSKTAKDKTYADMLKFFLMHRHFKCDVHCFVQRYDSMDLRIRSITDELYMIKKVGPFSFIVKIPSGVYIPPKDDTSHIGDIITGYYKPSLLKLLTCKKILRSRYYPYFNSFDTYDLPDLPGELLVKDFEKPHDNADFNLDFENLKDFIAALSSSDFGSIPDLPDFDIKGVENE